LSKRKIAIPLVKDLSSYSKEYLTSDVIAGITVAILLIPQGMAYAYLAGMPPIYGLYGGLVPLIIYAIFGTSRQLSIGPVAISALLVLAGVSQIAEPGSAEYIELTIITGLLIGLLQMILGVFKLGFLVNFISHPVLAGFTSAAAVIIFISQLRDVLGFSIPRFEHAYETLIYAVKNVGDTNLLSLAICLGAIISMSLLRRIHKSIPFALIVVVIGTLACAFLDLPSKGLAIVGAVPSGLPALEIPNLTFDVIKKLLPTVLTVTLIGIVESLSIAKVMDSKHDYYNIQPNRELFALGLSKFGGAFFNALPTSGSFTRSAINNESGGRTGVSSLITAFLVLLTLLFFTSWFYYLPKAILAAIILLAVKSLFDFKEAKFLWRTHKRDFSMMATTFVVTLLLGIEFGVLAGVVLSIGMVLYRSSKPDLIILGHVPGTKNYRNINRFEINEHALDKLILRFDEKIYFGNADYFKESIRNLVNESDHQIKHLLIDAKTILEIDSSGIHALEEVLRFLKKENIRLYFCGAIGVTRDMLIKTGLHEAIGEENHFLSLHAAMETID